jgi:hypothetical protein
MRFTWADVRSGSIREILIPADVFRFGHDNRQAVDCTAMTVSCHNQKLAPIRFRRAICQIQHHPACGVDSEA